MVQVLSCVPQVVVHFELYSWEDWGAIFDERGFLVLDRSARLESLDITVAFDPVPETDYEDEENHAEAFRRFDILAWVQRLAEQVPTLRKVTLRTPPEFAFRMGDRAIGFRRTSDTQTILEESGRMGGWGIIFIVNFQVNFVRI
ncbi:hypothetical protein CERSUDRAFT_106564 [Gelatoporia subvermispora B]|uniref:Uncharacterized protein n=1 Tax=Ceriporiopsis subvermispora (strain B) TaxID=914234 RepID=M2PIG3_CERS8|nr:hypothetical protein CERSUDRAFT_106564 [Gelatoporia subvermispora B]